MLANNCWLYTSNVQGSKCLPRQVFLELIQTMKRETKTIELKIRVWGLANCSEKGKQTRFIFLNQQFDMCRIHTGLARR